MLVSVLGLSQSLSIKKTLWASAHQLAAENSTAPISALVWWIIPITALTGGLVYAYWVTRLKVKYENQTERSVGRFKKFQDSFHQAQDDIEQENLEAENSTRDER
ncbi:MAG: hypothetical protein RLZZ12_842 [Actinomycetota bacterium]|jgi:hypothetical protein